MSGYIDLTGQKFGKLTVIRENGSNKHNQKLWLCRCECGNLITVAGHSLRRGNTKSCGCWRGEIIRASRYKHGASNTKIYNTWVCMRERCNKPNYKGYENYGGRGIKVCNEWDADF